MTTAYEPPDLTGTQITWGDGARSHAGYYVYPGRRVALIPGRTWPNAPEECVAEVAETEWLAGGRLLVCLGCGLDAT
jgi:hypothetical protein